MVDALLVSSLWLMLNYFIISTGKWSYSFIDFLISQVIYNYQLNYFFMSSETCKEYRDY